MSETNTMIVERGMPGGGNAAPGGGRRNPRKPGEDLAELFEISTRGAVRNILEVFDAADTVARQAGAAWYPVAGRHARAVAELGGIPVGTAAAVLAQLSPRTSWVRNVAGAYALVTDPATDPAGCLSANVARARVALAAPDGAAAVATVRGQKTSAFCRNILGDMRYVTVDTWAVRIAVPDMPRDIAESRMARVGGYDAIVHAYRTAAARRAVSPAVMQATTWVARRGTHRHEGDTDAIGILSTGALLKR